MCILQFSTWERAYRWTRCRTTTRLPGKLVFASVFFVFAFQMSDAPPQVFSGSWHCSMRIQSQAILCGLMGTYFPHSLSQWAGLKSFANYIKYLVGPTVGAFISFCWLENILQILDASVGELRRNMAFSRPSRKSWHRVPLRPLRGYDATHRNIWQGKIWRSRG